MGKFSGVLICSDWDGTLHTQSGVSRKDVEAIRYFQENGGLFTVCSGRPAGHFAEFFTDFKPNTHILALNGAVIADYATKEVIHKAFLPEECRSLLKSVIESGINFKVAVVHYEECGEAKRIPISSIEDFDKQIPLDKVFKIVFITLSKDTINEIKRHLASMDTSGYSIVSSWENSLEILSASDSKGAAVKRLKSLTDSHTLITVGDYENDIDMLKAADISYAVYNAPDSVKRHATYHLPSDTLGESISAIIEQLDTNSATK